jgi:hypothetical protein
MGESARSPHVGRALVFHKFCWFHKAENQHRGPGANSTVVGLAGLKRLGPRYLISK